MAYDKLSFILACYNLPTGNSFTKFSTDNKQFSLIRDNIVNNMNCL